MRMAVRAWRRHGTVVASLLAATLAVAGPGTIHASGNSKSGGNSSDSKGSNDSSKSSGDSSKSSGASSERSGQSTENSPRDSTKGTSDESTKSKGGQAISVALVIVVVGGAIVGGVLTTRATAQPDPRHTQALVRFLRRNHALVTRDVLVGEGPVLASWAQGLGLDPAERERLGRTLAGSPEQAALLHALDGPIDEARARQFAASFTRLARRALGEARVRAIALAASS
jgi:hypothetical protein